MEQLAKLYRRYKSGEKLSAKEKRLLFSEIFPDGKIQLCGGVRVHAINTGRYIARIEKEGGNTYEVLVSFASPSSIFIILRELLPKRYFVLWDKNAEAWEKKTIQQGWWREKKKYLRHAAEVVEIEKEFRQICRYFGLR